MNLDHHCSLFIICIYFIQNWNCLRHSVNIVCLKCNPLVPALVHHVFMCTFKDTINLKSPCFWQQLEYKPNCHWRVEEISQVQTDGHTWPPSEILLFNLNKKCLVILIDFKKDKVINLCYWKFLIGFNVSLKLKRESTLYQLLYWSKNEKTVCLLWCPLNLCLALKH
jgi:hypothetical protein